MFGRLLGGKTCCWGVGEESGVWRRAVLGLAGGEGVFEGGVSYRGMGVLFGLEEGLRCGPVCIRCPVVQGTHGGWVEDAVRGFRGESRAGKGLGSWRSGVVGEEAIEDGGKIVLDTEHATR